MKNLETERFILREWKKEDSKDLYEYAKNDLVGPNAGWMPHEDEEESLEIIEMFIEEGEVYAIVLKSENKVIGSIGLHDRKPEEAPEKLKQREVGFVINPSYWGKGYAKEAAMAVIRHGFEDLGLDMIWCAHYEHNERSKRVIEKCGFKYEFRKVRKVETLGNIELNTLYYVMKRR